MENLQDFRFYFADKKEIDAFIAADDTLEAQEQKIQTSRMRRAWAVVRRNELENENHIATPSAAELDDLVEKKTTRISKYSSGKDTGQSVRPTPVPLPSARTWARMMKHRPPPQQHR